jgi:parallel beta helix pectate lyase-like protein
MHELTDRLAQHSRLAPARALRLIVAAVCAIAVILSAVAASSEGSTRIAPCQKVASPSGSDRAPGTLSHPYRTAERLVRALRRGETGCLRAGLYSQDVTIRQGGSRGHRIVLRSYPGETATVWGRLYIARRANFVTVSYLRLVGIEHGHECGAPCASPTVNASHTSFLHDDVTNYHTAICFLLGDSNGVYGPANYTTIGENRIHDCGLMPPTNHQHGIYMEQSYGSRIIGNWIYNNADRGVQLYPHAVHTLVRDNLIDSNGQGIVFGALGGLTSSHNLVERNVITDARVTYNVASYYRPGVDRVGRANVVRRNCIGGGPKDSSYSPGGIEHHPIGFSVHHNIRATAHFALRVAHSAANRTAACQQALRVAVSHAGP